MPPSVQQSNHKHYKGKTTITEIVEFEGPHLMTAAGGLGGDRRPRPRLGAASTRGRGKTARVTDGPDHPRRRPDDARSRSSGWRMLTDPTFDPPGRRYRFGWGTGVAQARGPGDRGVDDVGADRRRAAHPRPPRRQPRRRRPGAAARRRDGRHDRPRAPRRLGGGARGLAPWETTTLDAPGRPTIEVTATPCRHGPPLSHPIVGDVIGFALRWDGQEHGDAVDLRRHRALRRRPRGRRPPRRRHRGPAPRRRAVRRHRPAALHDDRRGTSSSCAACCARASSIPVHYEGWTHFRDGRDGIERALAAAPADVRDRVRWLPIGTAEEVGGLGSA